MYNHDWIMPTAWNMQKGLPIVFMFSDLSVWVTSGGTLIHLHRSLNSVWRVFCIPDGELTQMFAVCSYTYWLRTSSTT